MTEKLWLELAALALGAIALIGVFKTKEPGFGPKTNQALILALVVPVTVILGVEKLLDSQALAAIMGGVVGFGAAKAMSRCRWGKSWRLAGTKEWRRKEGGMVELSENCAETRPSYGSAPIWKGSAPLCMGAGEVSGGALCKSWSQSRRLLYTIKNREAKTEIPA